MYYYDAIRLAEFGVSPDEVHTLALFAPEALPSGSTQQLTIYDEDGGDVLTWDSVMIWRTVQ